MTFTLAIVGRPNVGKSTLFNRLAGRALAIVHDTPGVTRDRKIAEITLEGMTFNMVDTAGFEKGPPESLSARMTAQTVTGINEADACLFVVDGRNGITAGDEEIARALRRSGKPVILAANKCEGRLDSNLDNDLFRLGFGDAVHLSAEHRLGFADLAARIAPFVPVAETETGEEDEDTNEIEEETEEADIIARPLKLAIVGRPNVGKSSLFNRLLGEERSLAGPEAGLTRDAVVAPWQADGRDVLLYDTAGMRKKARVAGKTLEELSVDSALSAIRFADCVVVILDATAPFEKQELVIADLIAREGRAIVFAVNKWDLVGNKAGAIGRMREKLDRLLPQVTGAPLIAISAATGEGIDRLTPAITAADKAWNTRISTATLNRFLESALSRHAPPAVHGRRVRIRYMTQVKSRPPTFALFGNQLDALPEAYVRYLTNGLREAFNLQGAPLRVVLRNTKNPYAPE